MGRRLLERDTELSVLASAASEAAHGSGSVVLVYGEAGIGKTSVVSALRSQQPAEGRMLVGSCDALSTPRTLGPLRDLAHAVGPRLAEALTGGDRDAVLTALYDELATGPPTTLVVEDVHWADEATLDALRFVARRLESLPVVLVLTYRDDELERDHPLGQLLGDLGHGELVRRLALARLSPGAVSALTAGSRLDASHVYGLTDGNPYFVTELVASANEASVPPTVVDAVLGRLRRLPGDVQDLVEQLAVIPSAVGRELLQLLAPDGLDRLRAAEQRGILAVQPDSVRFRHELTRRAVADALPVARRVELNRHALEALRSTGVNDTGRLAHHAAEAGDTEAVVTYAPRAAEDAAASGSHREAVRHYALALAHEDRYDAARRADLWEQCAVECYTIGAGPAAVEAQLRAVALRRQHDVPTRLGASLRWLSRMQWFAGDRRDAERSALEATAALKGAGDPGLYGLALSNQAQLAALAHDSSRAIELASQAIPIAREVDDPSLLSHALTNLGFARNFKGQGGNDDLLEAARVALQVDDMENASRAYVNLVWGLLDDFQLDEASRYLSEALLVAERAEFIAFLRYMQSEAARLELARADWDAALRTAEPLLTAHQQARCVALTVTGTAYARRGDPEAAGFLMEAQELAERLDELQRLGPVGAARVEAAMLRGDVDEALAVAAPLYAETVRLGALPLQAELAHRLRQLGQPVPAPDGDHPFAIQARGSWREAADAWERLGCPYHQAAALADSHEPARLVEALGILDHLGAVPLARRIRAELRERGVRNVPRGPAVDTRKNPANLTDRQLDVLVLLTDGLTNAEIAERLVVSVRTVDSHVAAVLDKLGVATRQAARDRAIELGLARSQ